MNILAVIFALVVLIIIAMIVYYFLVIKPTAPTPKGVLIAANNSFGARRGPIPASQALHLLYSDDRNRVGDHPFGFTDIHNRVGDYHD